ncbi:hypothetical protein ZIOFF_002134 [Zingiber officinale]|uniref:Uncharacterized protein n=1 Tax=Zingiber officinale TaxID=94328 RepID=A0A8J5HVU8_ZINOF|nr:hypothetical protein ZIOFF_002134 [Zingiber officinale]
MYIRGQGKIDYITGNKKAHALNDLLHAIWDGENSMVMAWLANSMEEDISTNYMCYSTVKELWGNVSQMYSDLDNQSQVFELTLNTYEWKSADDYNHHKKIMEDDRIYKFLTGLNVEFDEVRGKIIGRLPLPSIGEVFVEVRREESRRSVMLGKRSTSESIENSALFTNAANYQRGSDDKPRVCKQGEKNFGIPTANEVDSGPFNKEQMDQLLKLIKSNFSSHIPSFSLAQTGPELGDDDWAC